jgi:predicted flap endonuclease-1-like 5' DNA nuclease
MDPLASDPWSRTMTSAFRFWLSFWPVAPLFGVEWRFAELAGGRAERVIERRVVIGAEPAEEAAAAAEVAEEAVEEAVVAADDLTRIKGIGPGLARQLEALGFRTFRQLAALSEEELAAIDAKLTSIKGRCFRDDWIGQARALAG